MFESEIATFRKNADHCQRRYDCAANRVTKAEWLDLTTQWHWIATQAERKNGTSEQHPSSEAGSLTHDGDHLNPPSISSSIGGGPAHAVDSSGYTMNNVVQLFDRNSSKPGLSEANRIETAVKTVLVANAELDHAVKGLSKHYAAIDNIIASVDDAETRNRLTRSTKLSRDSLLSAALQLTQQIKMVVHRDQAILS
jgi:hypothetical protein